MFAFSNPDIRETDNRYFSVIAVEGMHFDIDFKGIDSRDRSRIDL